MEELLRANNFKSDKVGNGANICATVRAHGQLHVLAVNTRRKFGHKHSHTDAHTAHVVHSTVGFAQELLAAMQEVKRKIRAAQKRLKRAEAEANGDTYNSDDDEGEDDDEDDDEDEGGAGAAQLSDAVSFTACVQALLAFFDLCACL